MFGLISCSNVSIKDEKIVKKVDSFTDSCKLNENATIIDSIILRYNAKSLYDSFINCTYVNNFNVKYFTPNKDSISFLSLKIMPFVIAFPRGDTTAVEIGFYISDGACSLYFDSLYNQDKYAISMFKFTTGSNQINTYSSRQESNLVIPGYMDFKKKIKSEKFIRIINDNYQNLDNKFLNFLKREKVI